MTEHEARQAVQAAANDTGRAQNLVTSGVPGQYRMLEDSELRDWRCYALIARFVPEIVQPSHATLIAELMRVRAAVRGARRLARAALLRYVENPQRIQTDGERDLAATIGDIDRRLLAIEDA